MEEYRTQALRYLENAAEVLGKEEWEKGAEFIWGALAEALKAVALSNDRLLRTHSELRRFARELSKERQDPEISEAFARGERLHSDFYESFLDPEDIAEDMEHIRRAVGKLLGLTETRSQAKQE
ncbi:MAG: HEPN domain-containing protein [Chloroflexi bacterium]|nr:HEPN domain-containing protein [Chloroflexota bacterium]